jgi:hypothetical protein
MVEAMCRWCGGRMEMVRRILRVYAPGRVSVISVP